MKLYYSSDDLEDFPGTGRYDYPESIIRLTAGTGSDVLLVVGSEKTALIDCGMAYCSHTLIDNLHETLKKLESSKHRHFTLDYILLTHTHYDHIGALSEIKREWPDAVTCASEYGAYTLSRDTTIQMISHMSDVAAEEFTGHKLPFTLKKENMQADRILKDGDTLLLGYEKITAILTPGHTNCCLSFFLEPGRILFLSESTGMARGPKSTSTCILKSFIQAFQSIKKCMALPAEFIVFPHYGIISSTYKDSVFNAIIKDMRQKQDFVTANCADGMSPEAITEKYIEKYWKALNSADVPYEAFTINSTWEVKAILKESKLSLHLV